MNIATIIVLMILIAIVALIIGKMIKDKRAGKSSCGCNCGHCHGACGTHHHSS